MWSEIPFGPVMAQFVDEGNLIESKVILIDGSKLIQMQQR